MKKKVCIISYTFPPTPGIGGRRWVKFAKYLNKNNIDIKVISTINQSKNISKWNKDVISIKNKVRYINSNYPKYFGLVPKTIFEKILYRLSKFYCIIKIKGNYYDPSAHWNKKILKTVEKEINNGYNNIIITCGPFIQSYYLSKIKIKYPNINFIVDFRDPWTNNTFGYGYSSLATKRYNFEKTAEKHVINTADYIISVYPELSNYFSSLDEKTTKSKFITIPNGYDNDDIPKINKSSNINDKLTFIFAGTLYNNSIHLFEELTKVLKIIKKENNLLYNTLHFKFYGNTPKSFYELTKDIDVIKHYGIIPLNEVYNQISKADLCMLFLIDDFNFSLSTKFYEYIAMNTPIACFAKKGKITNFIDSNKIGYSLHKENIKEILLKIINDYQNSNLIKINNFNISEYSIANLTKKVIKILK